uniref:Ulp1 protease family, C-terminal catalytic domain-containing protein n=1 Tax=Tanacetum cinerariifolium TaxID=118510 RepID=A0A6L2KRQ6_TANCI|nr:hypothetical protein [Tanacetum cinerariifolium]
MLSDSDENKHRNKLPGVKAIDRVSSIKSKLKDIGKSNSPKSRWVPMSERVLSLQPVSQYNPITGEVRKESEKEAVVKKNYVVSKSKVAAVVSEKSNVVNESVVKSIEKLTVVKERDVTSKVGKSNVSAVVSEKSAVDDNPKVSKVSDESNKAKVVAPVIDKVPVATKADKETEPVVVADVKPSVVAAFESVVEKDNPKVTSKVSDESVKAPVIKESVKVPVIKKSVKASSVVTDKSSSENQDKIDVVVKKSVKSSSVVTDKPSSVVADKVDVVVKKSVKASSVVTDKSSSENQDKIDVVVKKSVKSSSVVTDKPSSVVADKKSVKSSSVVADKSSSVVVDKVDVVKDKVDVVADKASDALKNKLTGNGKKPAVGKDKDKPTNIAQDVVKEKFKPNPKQKEDDRKKKLKGKSKKDVSDSELETDVVNYSSDEADRKRKKSKIKAGLKRNNSGSNSFDSSKIDTKIIKRLISKLEKKVKKQESDEDSVPKKVEKEVSDEESLPKKGNKKLIKKIKKEESDEDSIPKKGKKKENQLTPKEAAHEEYLSIFPSFHARATHSSLFSAIKNSRVDILRFLTDIGFSSLHNITIDHLPSKLGWFAVSKFKSYMLIFDSGDKIEVTPSKIHDILGVPFGGYSLFDLDEREADHEFVRKWTGQFYPLELKKVRVNDIARKLIAAQEIYFLFKVNFLTLFTNTMGKADGLKGQICLDVVRRLHEDFVISDIDWCGYIYDCLQDSKLLGGTNHYLGPLTFLILLNLDSTKFDKFLVVRTRPAIRNWSSYLMKQRQELELKDHVVGLLDLHDEWNEAEVQESKGFIGFSKTFEKEDLIKKVKEKLSLIYAERVILEDYMRKSSLKCPGDGKFVALHEKYVNLFKDPIPFEDYGNGDNVGDDDDDENGDDDGDPNGSNPSFGFSKISLENFGNNSGPTEKDKVVEGNPTEQGTVVEGNEAEEGEIMSTPENFTQWLEKNVDLVGEGDLFGDNSGTLEAMNQEITPEKLPTQKGSPSPKKRAVKPSSYLLSPYMKKKTNVVLKITRMEFILGNSLFAMQGDKMVIQSKSHEIYSESHVIHSEYHVIHSGSHSKSMFNGTLASFDAKWESFSNQVNAQLKGNKGGLALGGIDLVFFLICKSEHFYVVFFSLTKTTAMTILDNSPGTYDSKYKEVCDLLKKLFAWHLKQYGHIRYTQVVKVKHTIPKLKCKTKKNFHDCGIFTILHMETFDGGPASNLDCGLPVESQLQRDMLRRLRFKFAMKILLHEINVHAGKMLELAKEFDKPNPVEKMAIIVDAFKKKEERECI